MMKGSNMRFVGDIHGKVERFTKVCEGIDYPIVQVGDFGYGFFDHPTRQYIDSFMESNPNVRFIRGNHDDPELCKSLSWCIPDGTYDEVNGIMYIGGAQSYDREIRKANGYKWWPDEQCSFMDLYEFHNVYNTVKPRIMVTHDAPESISYQMFLAQWGKVKDSSRTAQAFDAMIEVHKPDMWIFGHWHENKRFNYRGCEFICIAELGHIDIQL